MAISVESYVVKHYRQLRYKLYKGVDWLILSASPSTSINAAPGVYSIPYTVYQLLLTLYQGSDSQRSGNPTVPLVTVVVQVPDG